jgi:signal transduction histidine kinase
VVVRLEEDRFIVSDTGIGIHSADAERIFQLHYRGEASTGEGVGLSLVKRICDRFDWTISVSGQEGRGTTVEVRFVKGLAQGKSLEVR